MKIKIAYLILFQLTSCCLFAQELLPFVENYSKLNYQGDNQIRNVKQGNDGAMYFANNHYLLRYDGVKWEKNRLPNKTIIRSIFIDGNRIYSGSYKEFGYWYRTGGQMKYVSISKNKRVFDDKENEEIWKIFKFNNKIYFQSFNGIYIVEKNRINKVKLPFLISYCFVVNNQLLIATVQNGVYKMKGKHLKRIKGWQILKNNVIHAIENHQDKIYIFTKKNGIYIEEKGVLNSWKNPLNTILKTANINVCYFIKNKLIIGTANNGLYIFDLKSKKYRNINRNNVLINNSILSITTDGENDLWLGLDNGIAHVEVSSPIAIFYDNSGTLGSVYSVSTVPNGYLMASNHGIFKYENNNLALIPNSQGQAWNISKVNSNYLIGHNEGTFVYENNTFSKLNNIHGGWNFTKSGINNLYFQSTYSGIIIYNNLFDFTKSSVVQKLLKPIKQAAQNKKMKYGLLIIIEVCIV